MSSLSRSLFTSSIKAAASRGSRRLPSPTPACFCGDADDPFLIFFSNDENHHHHHPYRLDSNAADSPIWKSKNNERIHKIRNYFHSMKLSFFTGTPQQRRPLARPLHQRHISFLFTEEEGTPMKRNRHFSQYHTTFSTSDDGRFYSSSGGPPPPSPPPPPPPPPSSSSSSSSNCSSTVGSISRLISSRKQRNYDDFTFLGSRCYRSHCSSIGDNRSSLESCMRSSGLEVKTSHMQMTSGAAAAAASLAKFNEWKMISLRKGPFRREVLIGRDFIMGEKRKEGFHLSRRELHICGVGRRGEGEKEDGKDEQEEANIDLEGSRRTTRGSFFLEAE